MSHVSCFLSIAARDKTRNAKKTNHREKMGKEKGERTYIRRMRAPITPQHRHVLHPPRKCPVHDRIPVVGPVNLAAAAVPLLDVGWGVVEGEAALGEGGARGGE